MVKGLILTIFLILMLCLIARVIESFLNVLAGGVEHTNVILKGRVTFRNLWNGTIPDSYTGRTREGLRMKSTKDGLVVQGMRTIAKDDF
jgi:hypothetical protein